MKTEKQYLEDGTELGGITYDKLPFLNVWRRVFHKLKRFKSNLLMRIRSSS